MKAIKETNLKKKKASWQKDTMQIQQSKELLSLKIKQRNTETKPGHFT